MHLLSLLAHLIATEARPSVIEKCASKSRLFLALQAGLLIDVRKLHQGPVDDLSQLMMSQRAILPEHEKRVDAQQECRYSTAGMIQLDRDSSLPPA